MKWDYWICLYTETYCIARRLRPATVAAYQASLRQFREYVRVRGDNCSPDAVTTRLALEYVEYLRKERCNCESAVNRHVTILKNFYRAMVAMEHLEPRDNPMTRFPKITAPSRRVPRALSLEEVEKLLTTPPDDTVLGLRDRAILALLYGTGIRASECAGLINEAINWQNRSIVVTGKGGHQRCIPLNAEVYRAMIAYQHVRGIMSPDAFFFQSRNRRGMSRNAIYERVRTNARRARINKRVSPHKLRHTFATHLVHAGVGIVTIRDLLGHRQISSTQIYLDSTAYDLREAAEHHPIAGLGSVVPDLLPDVKLPFQTSRRKTRYG